MTERFAAYCRRKTEAARAAEIPGYTTLETRVDERMAAIGSDWSRACFDGPFYRSVPRDGSLPTTSLVFVQSRDGNTVVSDPALLGGGATDLHLVYEGLSRVDADAILAGAGSARARELVFSVWHPDLVALRQSRGRSRHPLQVVVTGTGNLRYDDGLMFLEPELSVAIVTTSETAPAVRTRVAGRPWIEVIDAGPSISFRQALGALRQRGVEVVSAIGGPRTAAALLSEGLVDDVYLTTSAVDGGEPGTPYHGGVAPTLARVIAKAGRGVEQGVRFEHGRVW